MRNRRRLAAFLSVAVLSMPNALAQKKQGGELTAIQQRTLKRLLADFRRARSSRRRRDIIAKRIATIGKPAIAELQQLVNKEMAPALQKYEAAFQKRAVEVAKQHLGKTAPAEIQRLRSSVLALKSQPNLTKDTIIRVADPALKQLQKLLVLDRKLVLKGAPRRLILDRQELAGSGRYWEFCVKAMSGETKFRPRKSQSGPTFEGFLQGKEQLAAQPLTSDAQTKAVLTANASLIGQLDAEEARNIQACNLMRSLLGLNVLAIDLKLCAAARDHSADMAKYRFFSHTSPLAGKQSFIDRANRFGTRSSGENIYMGLRDGLLAHTGWFHSPGHHRNMLGRHTRIGVGRSGSYFTQMFGR